MKLKTLKDRIEELKKGCGNIFKHGKDGEQVGCEKKDLCPNCNRKMSRVIKRTEIILHCSKCGYTNKQEILK